MKYCLVALLFFTLFTLGVAFSGSSSASSRDVYPDFQGSKISISSPVGKETYNKLRQQKNHGDCETCQSVDCDQGDGVSGEGLGKMASLEDCREPSRFILPMDIFLIPIEKQSPAKKPKHLPILSQSFWTRIKVVVGV